MRHGEVRVLTCLYILSLTLLVLFGIHGLQDAVTVTGASKSGACIILDAGHGGTDGGSSASDGTLESGINLEITLKTEAVLGLMGEKTILTRKTDEDLSDEDAVTISQKKITDIRNRVALVNSVPDSILISIHQNTYPDPTVTGAQVFFSPTVGSQALAELLQGNLNACVDPDNHRIAKRISADIYLMNHIDAPGILVECGFLTNPAEKGRLQSPDYQKQLAVAIAVTTSNYLLTDHDNI